MWLGYRLYKYRASNTLLQDSGISRCREFEENGGSVFVEAEGARRRTRTFKSPRSAWDFELSGIMINKISARWINNIFENGVSVSKLVGALLLEFKTRRSYTSGA